MSDKVQLIKQEIERRISNLEQIGDRKEIEIHFPDQFKFIEMYEGLLLFIDTLPEESSVKGLTWKDVNTLDTLIDQVRHEFPNGISEKSFGLAILEKFQDYHDDVEEPVSEDFKEFEVEYFEHEKDNIVCVYDRHAGLVDGAQWQKEQIMAKAVDVTIAIPYPNGYGGYTQLLDSKEGLPFDENLKVLIIKQE